MAVACDCIVIGTLSMGAEGPVGPRLALKGIGGLWGTDAPVMPAVTLANSNANTPSMMMIGHRPER